jgi:6-phospho-3-hexuloisomerase
MIHKKINTIINEIISVLDQLNESEIEKLIKEIRKAKKITVAGSGRVGYAAKAFSMRLSHLGFTAFSLGDSNVPQLREKDLLLVCSGSGETATIYEIVKRAKESDAHIGLITADPTSRMGKLANLCVTLPAPSKNSLTSFTKSVQPMTTLNEQSLWIFFDALVLVLMEKIGETHQSMWARHSNLE